MKSDPIDRLYEAELREAAALQKGITETAINFAGQDAVRTLLATNAVLKAGVELVRVSNLPHDLRVEIASEFGKAMLQPPYATEPN